jgi:NADPH-dependent 2,4-dienoyl-CoA reductase/sulfur reductase-like enzyme/rhodanese-related sulfurtransferase
MKIIIVGGVAAGASAATRARRLSEEAEIILLERGPDVSFANCGLPYHIGSTIPEREDLLVASPEFLRQRFKLDVRVNSSVESIDRKKKTVRVRRLDSQKVYTESYDKLILAPGAAPLKPPLPGIDLPGIFTLRNLQDMDRIKSAVGDVKQAVVVGAGFIGLELVENLVALGIDTSLVELQEQILPPFDREMTSPLVEKLKEKGVSLFIGESAESFEKSDEGLLLRLKSGRSIPAQLVVLGIGVRPENQLAVDAGLGVGPRGGIHVDAYLQSDDPDIYAAGDAVEIKDVISGKPTQIPLAGPANRQGRLAADNVFNRKNPYRGTQGTAILSLFGLTAAMTGASEKILTNRQENFHAVYLHPKDHAGYYPGAKAMSIKLLFEKPSGRILGAQIVGENGVDKRIDVISVAIQAGMTVFDLEEMELAYAPPYGSAKDPVNMAGFIGAGLLRGDHPQIDVAALLLAKEKEKGPLLIDMRTPGEYEKGHISGAENIPLDDLRESLDELPRDRELVVYCRVGQRGYLATRILIQKGFSVKNLSGGYQTFRHWKLQA